MSEHSIRVVSILAVLLAPVLGACPSANEAPAATPRPAVSSGPVEAASGVAPGPSSSAASVATPGASAAVATSPTGSASVAPAVAAVDETGDIVGTISLPGGKAGKSGVAWIEDAPKVPGAGDIAWIDNKAMMFLPFVTVLTTGGKVTFHNSDPFPHNVFSPDGSRFDLGTVPMNGARGRTFEKPGAYTLLCNLHPNMVGYIVVVPSSYFAKADANGKYRIKQAPGGNWHVNAWAPRMKGTAQPVKVRAGEATVDLTLAKE